MEARPGHIYERNMHVKASAKRVQDLGKGDIIGGGDLCMYVYVHCSTKIVEQPHTHVLGGGKTKQGLIINPLYHTTEKNDLKKTNPHCF